jgi:hypothetical protein
VCPKKFVSFFSGFPLLTLLLEIKNNRTPYRNLKENVVWESNDFILHVKALNCTLKKLALWTTNKTGQREYLSMLLMKWNLLFCVIDIIQILVFICVKVLFRKSSHIQTWFNVKMKGTNKKSELTYGTRVRHVCEI